MYNKEKRDHYEFFCLDLFVFSPGLPKLGKEPENHKINFVKMKLPCCCNLIQRRQHKKAWKTLKSISLKHGRFVFPFILI